MSGYNEWDDDDFDLDGDDRGSQENTGMKELRKAFNALKKQHKELQESYSLVTQTQRERSVRDVLNSLGLPEKVSAFIPDDVASEEDVVNWIEEYGDVFGVQLEPEYETEGQEESSQDYSALNRISQTQAGGQAYSGDTDQLDSMIRNAETPEELNKILFGSFKAPEVY
jgi:hypothetical protein